MLFNSNAFLFQFLPLVLVGFYVVGRLRHGAAIAWLLVASLVFYGVWNVAYLPVLVISVGINFLIGRSLTRTRGPARRRLLVVLGVTANLVALGYYKYAGFFARALDDAGLHLAIPHIVLPLGISFFTFTQIMYLVDVHRGVAREQDLWKYALFVTYFPHLIAGPLLHHRDVMPQFGRRSIVEIHPANVRIGLTLLAIGLAKKVLIADSFAGYATPVFDAASAGAVPGTALAWTGVIAYGLQLYFDFSAYSDMAIGISLLFNVRLPLNFNSPYQATSVIDFWRRWHMTLSRFLRDYLYIPMGGNRRGIVRQNANILVTMLLGGLWHGANWTFVLWGAIHGVLVVVNHAIRAASGRFARATERTAFRVSARALTLFAVFLAWVPFRADSIHTTLALWRSMLAGAGTPSFAFGVSHDTMLASMMQLRFAGAYADFGGAGTPLGFFLLLILAIFIVGAPASQSIAGYDPTGRPPDTAGTGARDRVVSGIAVGLLLFLGIRGLGQVPSEFLYFQF